MIGTCLLCVIFTMRLPINSCTVDVTLDEYEFLANHLTIDECQKLVASLYFKSFELDRDVENAEDAVPMDVGCLKLLLHWNSAVGEGRGTSHEKLSLRLRQMGRADLSSWLDSAVLEELDEGIDKAVDDFQDHELQETEKGLSTENESYSINAPTSVPPTNLTRKKPLEPESDSWFDIALTIIVIAVVVSVSVYLYCKINSFIEKIKYEKLATKAFTISPTKKSERTATKKKTLRSNKKYKKIPKK
ncbi:uncharacterized protein LOC124356202 [Homalodisca vitripennis]|uniref:uncharacterized protein LOC124356202 n=1 Tax=Homalodisca vitripennis TaxID=197043 RepID=UPI001EEB4980|nr:uncharacterized protein LOC124356202 [Homalodisca vitripennis]